MKFCKVLCTALMVHTLTVSAQSGEQNSSTAKAVVTGKKTIEKTVNGTDTTTKTIGWNNSGIIVKQNHEGIIFKSHLHDYPEVRIELLNRNRELLYEYSNEMKKGVDYNLSVNKLPKGEYILNFEFENMLVVCNVQISK